MLITFKTKAYAEITMFGEVATRLLKLMGQSGVTPGAILAEDVGVALEQLKSGLASGQLVPAENLNAHDEDDEELEAPISLNRQAFPLIELLSAAVVRRTDVLWDSVGT